MFLFLVIGLLKIFLFLVIFFIVIYIFVQRKIKKRNDQLASVNLLQTLQQVRYTNLN